MVDVVLQCVWVLYHINKVEGDESLLLLAFQRDVANVRDVSGMADDPRAMLEFEISHHMFVMMAQNISRYNLKNKVGVRYANRTLDAAR